MLIKSRMHPKNIYKNPPNFKELAIQYPEFRKHVKNDLSGKVTIDYQDQNAVKELTRTLLKKDFDLKVDILESRLIPRIPLSLNYILWIEDLLKNLPQKTQPLGIDIGTGCVCIYSLLAARKGWQMLATELDLENFKQAEQNIRQNNLNDVISVKLVSNSSDLLIGVINNDTEYDFCMCNPPFFKTNEKPLNRTSRRHQLETVPSEMPTEISVEGGEMAFISKLIEESKKLKEQIKIYTTLVGKKSDFIKIKKEIQKVSPKSVAFTEFGQGRTIRWGVAWSFLDINLEKGSGTPGHEITKKNKSKPLLFNLPSNKFGSVTDVLEDTKNVLTELKIVFNESHTKDFALEFKAFENTWSHQRKKKRQKEAQRGNIYEAEIKGSGSFSENCSEAKRPRLDESGCSNKTLIVEGLIFIKDGEPKLFELLWVSGNKESLHQIFQYFKNHWNKT